MLHRELDATTASAAPQAGAAAAAPEGAANPPPKSAANIDRWNRGAWIFRNETLRKLEILLDEALSGWRTSFRAKKNRVTIDRGYRGVAQSGSASALGAEGRGFESLRPDH